MGKYIKRLKSENIGLWPKTLHTNQKMEITGHIITTPQTSLNMATYKIGNPLKKLLPKDGIYQLNQTGRHLGHQLVEKEMFLNI